MLKVIENQYNETQGLKPLCPAAQFYRYFVKINKTAIKQLRIRLMNVRMKVNHKKFIEWKSPEPH